MFSRAETYIYIIGATFANNETKTQPQHHLEHRRWHFMFGLITVDGVWIYHHYPKLKQDVKEWYQLGTSVSKRGSRLIG